MNEKTSSTFGGLLRAFRKRCRLTQRQLATALGVHINTIGIWERCEGLPEQRSIVLEMARRLRLDEQESRQFLEASLTALAPHWNVPFLRNPLFTGHEDVLEAMHTRLGVDQVVALTQSYAIRGLGGIGKTQLAVEYTYRYALEYSAVFWISAQSIDQILASFLAIAELLGFPERQAVDQQRMVAAVLGWLSNRGKWLLIWDNLEEVELLRLYLPPARRGAVLITTRRTGLGTLAQDLELPTMTCEEGMLLLLRRAKILLAESSIEDVKRLKEYRLNEYLAVQEAVTVLGGLPLAIDQAGAYIEATRCSVCDYMSLVRSSQLRLLDERDASTDYPLSVAKTFTLVFEQLEQENPAAVEIVTACAFLASDAIPEVFFLEGAAQLGTPFEELAADPFAFQLALKALLSSSLIQRDTSTHTLSIHRLVQVVLKGRLSPMVWHTWTRRIMKAMIHLFPSEEKMQADYWSACEQLLSHALTCLSGHENNEDALPLPLMSHVATYLARNARYAEAEPLFVRAAQLGERVLSSQHPLVAEAINGLGILYQEQGKYERAEPLLQRALHIWEQMPGPDHSRVAHSLNNLGNLYALQGKHEQAESLLQRALHIWEQIPGPDHSRVAHSLNNLGNLYALQGKHEQAESLLQQALHIWEQLTNSDSSRSADPLQHLDEIYREQGRSGRSELARKHGWHIWEQAVCMLEDPDVAYPLINLGNLYREQGKYEKAEPLYRRAWRIREQAMGPEHPLIAESLNGLASIYRDQGMYEKAEQFYQRALLLRRQHLTLQHPDVAETLYDLALLRQMQQQNSEAMSLYRQALAIRRKSLKAHHPQTLKTSRALHQLEELSGPVENISNKKNSWSGPEGISLCAGNFIDLSKSRGELEQIFFHLGKQRFSRNTRR